MEEYTNLQNNLNIAINMQDDSNTSNHLKLKWNNKNAIARVNQLFKVIGLPDTLNLEPGGIAEWKRVDPFLREKNMYPKNINGKHKNIYSKLVILDEEIPHIVPAPHTDWFYAYMYMDIPEHKLNDVRALTESISYDTMSRQIYARCHFFPALLVTLYLAKQIANGYKNLSHAQQEYSILIPILAKEEKEGKGLMAKDNVGDWHKTLSFYLFGIN